MNSAFRFGLGWVILAVPMTFGILSAVAEDDAITTNMDIVREKVRADKKFFVAQHMGLDESEAKAFWPVYDSYQEELTALSERSVTLIQEYANYFRSMTEEVASGLIDELLSIQSDRVKLRQAYLPQFRAVISEIMVARYYQIENKIQAVVDYELGANIPLIR